MNVGFAWMLALKVNVVCMLVSYVFALASNERCVLLVELCMRCVWMVALNVSIVFGYCLWL